MSIEAAAYDHEAADRERLDRPRAPAEFKPSQHGGSRSSPEGAEFIPSLTKASHALMAEGMQDFERATVEFDLAMNTMKQLTEQLAQHWMGWATRR